MAKKKKFHILNGKTEEFLSQVPLGKLEANLSILDTFGRMQCPSCGYELLTAMDAECPNCHLQLGKNRQPIDKDGTAKLAGGITAKEAMDRARKWWNKRMRHYFREQRERKGDTFRLTKETASAFNILMGRPFDELNRREKFQVVKAWHQAWLETEVIDPNTGEPT